MIKWPETKEIKTPSFSERCEDCTYDVSRSIGAAAHRATLLLHRAQRLKDYNTWAATGKEGQ